MTITKLSAEETRESGFTHKAAIKYTDLNTTAALTATLVLLSGMVAGFLVRNAAFRLVSGFVGASITTLTLKVGWNGATVDDDDGLIAAASVLTANSPILAGDATGAAFATLRTGFAPQESAAIEAVFTAIGANLTALTAGEVHVYLTVSDLSKL